MTSARSVVVLVLLVCGFARAQDAGLSAPDGGLVIDVAAEMDAGTFLPPVLVQTSPAPWPDDALDAGLTGGDVELALTIDAEGAVSD
ncbi:MAG: hypothetical protein JNM17_17150, partial [Archangium sp.]|nr:hypothetical protein [Archangium sp.]